MITAKQAKFFREAQRKQPDLKRLKALLLRFGGDFLVPPPDSDGIVPVLLGFGFLTNGPITMKTMKVRSCHENVAAVWKARKFGIIAFATGFALSNDGLWRRHSWGILRDGVLETTEPRLMYFGIVVQGFLADKFAESVTDSKRAQVPTPRRESKKRRAAVVPTSGRKSRPSQVT